MRHSYRHRPTPETDSSTAFHLASVGPALLAVAMVLGYAVDATSLGGRADANRAEPTSQEASPAPPASQPESEKPPTEQVTRKEEVVVTASGSSERVGDLPVTMQILDDKALRASNASSITDFLVENSVAYFDEWNSSQTQVNLRGGVTDPQGRDFGSQVIVLVNGRRSGTSNLSKLSVADLYRVEVLRGPGSVIYGSQAIGGVINLITKDGLRTPGRVLRLTTGSWGYVDADGQLGGNRGRFDYLVSAHGGRRGDYRSGKGSVEPMVNTGFQRYGGMLAGGYTPSPRQRIAVTVRSDGVYNAGFRGSAWDYSNYDGRHNESVDLTYSGAAASGVASWNGLAYFYNDIDDFHWGTEVLNDGGQPSPGFVHDDNWRRNRGFGTKAWTNIRPFAGNGVLAGLSGEWSRVRSTRVRVPVPGGSSSQRPPFDNNADNTETGLFIEDTQQALNKRLTFRAGVRADLFGEAIKATPNQPLLVEKRVDANKVTYRGGATYRLSGSLSARLGVGTGFRAPTATQLAADFTLPLGGQRLGNPNLRPEETTGVEAGLILQRSTVWGDIVLFRNHIKDRIAVAGLPLGRSQWVNRSSSDVTGLEIQTSVDLFGTRRVGAWLAANALYNLTMRDNDAAARGLNTDRLTRLPEYQATLIAGLRKGSRWSAKMVGVLHGPIWTDTEESLLDPLGSLAADGYIFKKTAFWEVNLSGRTEVRKHLVLTAGINNVLNVNADPIFLALNREPYLSDPRFSAGGRGNSIPGRQFVVGMEVGR